MNFKNIRILFSMLSLLAAVLACAVPGLNPAQQPEAPTATPLQVAAPTEAPAAPTLTLAPIEPALIPVSLPAVESGTAGDYDSSKTAAKRTAAGDRFTFERFERPFNANTMDVYLPQIDIIKTTVSQDTTFIYSTITLRGRDANNNLSGRYAVELDLDLDSRGDWLIIATAPSSLDWTSRDVQVYHDANKDVGGNTSMMTDKKPVQTDGFETLVFDSGQGGDPDSAAVRISPDDPNTVEIAVKAALLGSPVQFMAGVWAGNKQLDPSLFDFSDHFTHTEAGAADKGLDVFYPIKALSELDNSCRLAIGFWPRLAIDFYEASTDALALHLGIG